MKDRKNAYKNAESLINYIYDSPTAFHAAKNSISILKKNGFIELSEGDSWNLEKGGRYFVTKNQSALVAFIVGEGEIEKDGFRIIAAHNDSPGFRIKPNPEIKSEGEYIKLNTEVYGGPIINTWLDRPLSFAGRVVVRGKNPFSPEIKFINVKRPLMLIPNLAIHLNRSMNEGVELNRQKHTLPLVSTASGNFENFGCIKEIICSELSVEESEILDFDLFLYEFEKGSVIGADNEFISSGRLDDLSMVYSGITAISNSKVSDATNLMVCFDNEEVGSTTKQGADSPMLFSVMDRISSCLRKKKEDFYRAISKSFIISSDLGHALHPNYQEKCDPVNRPIINKGPIIKISASQSYTSDSVSSSVYSEICRRAGVPVQIFVNRSDERGGSTIGPISSSHININSVDMGIAVLSMHSVRELGGVDDCMYTLKSFNQFYNL